ncbi:MAG: TolC family protein [Acidobacteriota bacterium]
MKKHRSGGFLCVLTLALLGTGAAVRAQEGEGTLSLSLQDALKIALEKNFDVRVQEINRDQAQAALKGAYGLYDPNLSFDWSTGVNRQPTSSVLQAGGSASLYMSRQDQYNLGLSQFAPWGQTFTLQWDNYKSRTNSLYSILNPTYGSSAALGTTVPLLKGFGKQVASRSVLQAKIDRTVADAQYQAGLRDALVQVERDYWNLVYAIRDLEVRRRSLDLAKTFQEETRKKIEVGVLAPIEQVAADAQVAAREQEIIASQQAVGDSADILKLALGITQDSPEWLQEIQPTDEAVVTGGEYEEKDLLAQALKTRPELIAAKEKVERAKLDTRWSKNQTLPSLDLSAGLTYNGISGYYVNPLTGQVSDLTFPDAWEQVTGLDYKSYYVALALKVPLGNRAARYQFQQFRLAQTAQEIALQKQTLTIANEVRSSLRGLEAARKRVAAARLTLRLQEEKLDAERKKYDNGLSTAFNVLSYQNDLAAAESGLLRAILDAKLAMSALDRAVGVYFETHGIEIK